MLKAPQAMTRLMARPISASAAVQPQRPASTSAATTPRFVAMSVA